MTSILDHVPLADYAISIEERGPHESVIHVAREALPAAARQLAALPAVALVNVTGLDERPLGRGFRVLFTFSLPDERFVTLSADLAADEPAYPAVSIDVHATDWYERENFDLFGIVPQGHPVPSHLVLHYDWPSSTEDPVQDLYPLRKDFPKEAAWPERIRAVEPPPRATGPGIFQYTVGPVRSGIMESGRFIISSLGEEIADVETRLFWKHRGIEKLCEGLPLDVVTLYAERVGANSAIAHSLAFSQAVETATATTPPERALVIRVVLSELERLFNRVNDLAMQADATGLSVGAQQGAILAEQLRRLNSEITGHRYLFGSVIPGGVRVDLTPQHISRIHDHVTRLQRDIRAYADALLASHSHLDRLEETGLVSPTVARDHALVGPIARASALDKDARRDHPYAFYRHLSFDVPVYEQGDALARNRVWIDEIFQSISLIEQALAAVCPGDLAVQIPPLAPYVEAHGWAEGPRGMVVHRIMANEDGSLYRYKIRTASFVNWHVFHLAAAGSNILTDFPIIERSFALILASNDR